MLLVMLLVDLARRRSTCVPLFFPALGLGLAVMALGVGGTADIGRVSMLGGLAIATLVWGLAGVRFVRREGDAITVRSLWGLQRVPAAQSMIGLRQGGGARSPHFDVLLRPAAGEPQVLARLEALSASRAPRAARRIAEALAVPVHEAGLAPFEAALAQVAPQQRAGLRWLAGIMAVGIVASVIMMLVADHTMATLVIRCPGGQVREGGATMLDGLELTTDPGPHVFELRPPDGPPWTQHVELVAGGKTVLDCQARPVPRARPH